MASAETRALLAADVWASSSDGAMNRQTPEAAGLTRTTGYGLEYQQADSGLLPVAAGAESAVSRVGVGFPAQAAEGHPRV